MSQLFEDARLVNGSEGKGRSYCPGIHSCFPEPDSLGLRVRELLADESVELVLHAGDLLQGGECQHTQHLVQPAYLADSQMLQIVQHPLEKNGRGDAK